MDYVEQARVYSAESIVIEGAKLSRVRCRVPLTEPRTVSNWNSGARTKRRETDLHT
jgi:hypothetical protein